MKAHRSKRTVRIVVAATRKLINLFQVTSDVPYSQKYWREFDLAVESQIAITNMLLRFKLQDRHAYVWEEEILADFKLAMEDRPPKRQIYITSKFSGYTVYLFGWVC